MSQVLKFPFLDVPRPGAGVGAYRRALRALLLRVADRAAQLAERLEPAEAPVDAHASEVAPARSWAPAGAGAVRFVEAVVVAVVAGYFVAGLVGVFVG